MIDINNGKKCSSEKALVFNFAWKLKERYQNDIELDFETTPFNDNFSDGKFLDLYAELHNDKLGFEFKYPKKPEAKNSHSNQTKNRVKAINDIKRLCWLKSKNKITKGYFFFITDQMPYINTGTKKECKDFDTSQGVIYSSSKNFPSTINESKKYESFSVENIIIPNDLTFEWNGIFKKTRNAKNYKITTDKKYAWLTPIII